MYFYDYYRKNNKRTQKFYHLCPVKEDSMEFTLTEEYIELIRLLKTTRIAESGGQAKLMVENGDVWRNGVREYRKRAKIRKGETITANGITINLL